MKKIGLPLLIFAGLFCLAPVALAQETRPAAPPAADAVEEYLLGYEDVLEISVVNHPDLNRTITILPDGMISFPEVGDVKAAGKTPKALAAILQAGVEKTRNRAQVVIVVKETRPKKIRILGAVRTSGSYDLKRGYRLMDAVAMAGGLSAKPIRVTGRLVRRGNEVLDLNLLAATLQPATDANPRLEQDDLILLDEREVTKQVHVMGQVNKPGSYDLTESTTLLTLLSEAGSANEKAALKEAYVLRGNQRLPVNLLGVLLQGKTDPTVTNFKLEVGDVLFIPEQEARFAVWGQVTKPGFYPYSEKEKVTILSALSTAGGQTLESDLRGARLVRQREGKTDIVQINLDDLVKKGRGKDITMEPGDVLFIPSRNRRPLGFQDFLSPITTILSFGVLR
jgi:polysaccharide export outer membrane protein